ncbi:MAG: hypothetical protein JNL87_12920 [Burkholderiaceae bacterium]|nr:hypothetical protein [Burkholderiaceae bacterium]
MTRARTSRPADEPVASAAATAAATRLEPALDADDNRLPPRFGGRWRADPDGGFTPLDEGTAIGAGLAWPEQTPPAAEPA